MKTRLLIFFARRFCAWYCLIVDDKTMVEIYRKYNVVIFCEFKKSYFLVKIIGLVLIYYWQYFLDIFFQFSKYTFIFLVYLFSDPIVFSYKRGSYNRKCEIFSCYYILTCTVMFGFWWMFNFHNEDKWILLVG